MSLDHAILGFLNYSPLSGYDLKKIFDISVRHFWSADQSQIYRTLARLAENGLVTCEVVEQDSRPDRKVYFITPKGREELHRWMNEPLTMQPARSAPLIRVFFALQYFRAGVEMMKAILKVYQSIPADLDNRIMQEIPQIRQITQRDRFFWLLTLESGIENIRSTLRWMESVIERLERKDYTNHLSIEEPLTER
jgi:PadR family transcriptional regulator AphA